MHQGSVETVTVAGRRVHVTPREDAGLVMLVRLAGAGGGVWDGLWPRLAAHHAVASVDLGPPDPHAAPRDVFEHFADAVFATASGLGYDRFHLVGWNGGAHIALAAALKAPAALESMVLMTPFRDVGERRQIDLGLDMLEHLLRTGQREMYAYHWFMAGFSDRFIEERFDRVAALAAQRLASDSFLSLDVDRAMRWMRALRRDHVSDAEVAGIKVPTLILAAGTNRWHAGPTTAMACALHRLIANSTLHVFDGLGSLFPLEVPDETAARILAVTAPAQLRD